MLHNGNGMCRSEEKGELLVMLTRSTALYENIKYVAHYFCVKK